MGTAAVLVAVAVAVVVVLGTASGDTSVPTHRAVQTNPAHRPADPAHHVADPARHPAGSAVRTRGSARHQSGRSALHQPGRSAQHQSGRSAERNARRHPRAAVAPASLSIGSSAVSAAVPPGFVGLSMEYRGFAALAGPDPKAVDPVFEQLLRDISPDQSGVLRVGGDSSDWSWYPVPRMAQPPGVKYDLTPALLSSMHAVAGAVNTRLILGLNLEADSPRIAAAEADAMISRIGVGSIDGLELGNEPELYGSFGWYKSPTTGLQVPGRPRGYGFSDYQSDFSRFAHSLPAAPLAGPSSGGPEFLANLGTFLASEPKVRLATVHAYPLKHCTRSQIVTMPELLSNEASHGLAETIAPYAAAAAAHGVPLRVDEMNAVSCGGYRGVSGAYGSALWMLDTLFEMAKLGINGINIHTVPKTINELLGPSFTGGRWQIKVHPEFYGMLMFAQAAPPGSRLLAVSGAPQAGVKVWATRGTDNKIRVVLINKNVDGSRVVQMAVTGESGPASVEQLLAPNVDATTGITLGGQTFGSETSTGVLTGPQDTTTLTQAGGTFSVTLPAASATLLTLPAG